MSLMLLALLLIPALAIGRRLTARPARPNKPDDFDLFI